jgi:hypothetical protein
MTVDKKHKDSDQLSRDMSATASGLTFLWYFISMSNFPLIFYLMLNFPMIFVILHSLLLYKHHSSTFMIF